MPVNLSTNPVRRSAKLAQRDLHKVRNEVKVASNATQGNFLLKLANLCVWIVTKEPFPKLELLSVPLATKVNIPTRKVNLHAKPVLQEKSQRWGHHASNHRTWLPKVANPTNI